MTEITQPINPVAEAAAVRSRLGPGWPWLAGSVVVALLVLSPVAGLLVFAARGSGDLWPHLAANVLPVAIRTTVILLLGVGVSVSVIGVAAAWLVSMFRFPGRRFIEVALILPLAVPTYIAAYAYLDVTHPVGPLQTFLRGLFGITDPRGLWFPEIRSMGGAIFLLAFVLYPYVYLPVRALFLMQSASMLEVARTLGAGPWRTFRQVALPLSRPALVVGVSLAMLEALNDIGASEFLGVRTLTVSIYTTWVTRSSIEGASQIALVMLAIVFGLILVEHRARRTKRYAGPAGRGRPPAPRVLEGWRGIGTLLLLALPIILGFVVPASYLLYSALRRASERGVPAGLGQWIFNSISLAAVAALVCIAVGLVLAYTVRVVRGRLAPFLVRVASIGYAIPGTVLAAGLLVPLASLDNVVANAVKGWTGVSPGLILTGSGAALVFAYVLRFLAVSAGGIEAGLARISPSIDMAARSLGAGPLKTVGRIHLPMLSPALAAAGLLVFVDCMKELPATLLLRPFNFETLATYVYGEAARGTYEDGAVAALAIVIAGLVPVALLARTGRR